MSFLKSLFGKTTPDERKITDVNQLKKGDFIGFNDSFGLPEVLRAKQFQISAVNSYEYEHHVQTEWVLTGDSNESIFLSLDNDDKVYLKLSLKIHHQDVEQLFDLDEFSTLFDEPGNATLNRQSDSDRTAHWSAPVYHQHGFATVGYFHRKDHRSETLSQWQGKDQGEQFELFSLFDDDEDRGIDVEVWQDGDTDVFLTLFRPTTDIIDMFPGS